MALKDKYAEKDVRYVTFIIICMYNYLCQCDKRTVIYMYDQKTVKSCQLMLKVNRFLFLGDRVCLWRVRDKGDLRRTMAWETNVCLRERVGRVGH